MMQGFLIPFSAIFLAELGDKTQLAVFCLSSKTKRHASLLAGVMLAFLITNGLAVMLGGLLTAVIPQDIIRKGAGVLFILFGVLSLLDRKEDAECELKSPFISGFMMILAAEMGDKTQIASAIFSASYDPLLVLAGAMCALLSVSILGIYFGRLVASKIKKKYISAAAAAVFIVLGISFLA